MEEETIDFAWECIEGSNQITEVCGKNYEIGEGIIIFKLLPYTLHDKFNCERYLAIKNGFVWNLMKNNDLISKYEFGTNVLISVQIPCDDGEYIGDLRLYDLEGQRINV